MSSMIPPPKTLVLLFDGTGNFFRKENTNIIRLFEALEHDEPDQQLLYYQPGVGTYVSPTRLWDSTFRSLAKLVDKAFARYLSDHVLKGYQFLMQHYRRGDRICLFGFSRGAYTARVLAGMLQKVGLLPMSNEEQVPFAWKHYEDSTSSGQRQADEFKKTFSRDVEIAFVGVWDTVASVGLFGRHYGYTRSNPNIKIFRHALALDERRGKFLPSPCIDPLSQSDESTKDSRLDVTTESRKLWLEEKKAEAPAGLLPQDNSRLAPPTGEAEPTTPGQTLQANHTDDDITVTVVSHVQDGSREELSGQVQDGAEEGASNNGQGNETVVGEELETHANIARYKEVWFAGCHSDVGGGSVTPQFKNSKNLANVSLGWMVKEAIAAKAGLLFRSEPFKSYPGVRDVVSPHLNQASGSQEPTPAEEVEPGPASLVTVLAEALGLTDALGNDPEQHADNLFDRWNNTQSNAVENGDREELPPSPQLENFRMLPVVKDASADMRDQLKANPAWWILEYLPIFEKRVVPQGFVAGRFRLNRGHGRVVLPPAPEASKILVHTSVLVRRCVSQDYRPRAIFKGAVHYVD